MSNAERRGEPDRRHQFQPFNRYAIRGRRHGPRRRDDVFSKNGGVDTYPPKLLLVTVAILLFCALDAQNTLVILSRGGTEVNPLMDFLIQTDLRLFVGGKFALTGLGILVFVGYHRVRLWKLLKVRYILYSLLVLYLLLIGYQLVLLAA
ncbi:MAG TPA: hypothetical protein ENJ24_01960 [Gammaproteobacteria bacterium]|nr:hypothetical protein [Gammaproteobacteria bacterium]